MSARGAGEPLLSFWQIFTQEISTFAQLACFFFFLLAWLARQTNVNYIYVHKMAMIALIWLKDIFITIRRGVRDLCNNE